MTGRLMAYLFIACMLISVAAAAEFTPQGNINLRNIYNISNVNNINTSTITATTFYGSGSGITGINGTDNSTWNEGRANTLYAGIEWDYNQSGVNNYEYNQTITSGDIYTTISNFVLSLTSSATNWFYNQTLAGQPLFVDVAGDAMTGNLAFGNNNITNVNKLRFNETGCSDSTDTGVLCWNNDKSTVNLVTGLGNIIQIGQEMTHPVRNGAGQTIYEGQIVYMSGVSGENQIVDLANASDGDTIHSLAMVTVPSCANNAVCPVTTLGEVHDLDTSGFLEGDVLYLMADGGANVTATAPGFPNYNVHLGEVIRSHASAGIINFRPEVDYGDGVTINELGVVTNLTVSDRITANSVDVGTWLYNQSSPYDAFNYNMSTPYDDFNYNMSLDPTITIWLYNQTTASGSYNYNETTIANAYTDSVNTSNYATFSPLNYNHTTISNAYTDATNLSNYNTFIGFNYNQSTPYDAFNYNQSTPYDNFNYNMSSPYDTFNYNMSDGNGLFETNGTSVYNHTLIAVGIRTAAPTHTLNVNGTANFTGNTWIGQILANQWLYNHSLSPTITPWLYNQTVPANSYTDSTNVSNYNTFITFNYNQSAPYDSFNYNQTAPAQDYADANDADTTYTNGTGLTLTPTINQFNLSTAYTDTLYANIQWDYNQSSPYDDFNYNMSLDPTITIWLYNQTTASGNFNYNETTIANAYTDATNVSNYNTFIGFNYNQSTPYDAFNYNMSAPYDAFNYNQTEAGSVFHYNQTTATLAQNAVWTAGKNVTTQDRGWFFGLFDIVSGDAFTSFNGSTLTITSTASQWFYNHSLSPTITPWLYNQTSSSIYFYNQSTPYDAFNYNQSSPYDAFNYNMSTPYDSFNYNMTSVLFTSAVDTGKNITFKEQGRNCYGDGGACNSSIFWNGSSLLMQVN